jgi:hypothetical protein
MAASASGRRGGLPPAARVPLLVLGFASLVVGIAAGLARLGVVVPDIAAAASAQHAPLMIGGFFGVVISLERAVALGRRWAYAAPLLGGAGGICTIAGATLVAPWLVLAASIVLLAATIDVFLRQRALFTLTLALGSLAWAVGNALWVASVPVHALATWWLAFLILTIAGERLELSRLLPPSRVAQRLFAAIVGTVAVGLVGAQTSWGAPLFGIGLLALAAWLAKHDIARRTVRGAALTRYIAVCLLSGYVWLAIGALVIVIGGILPGTPARDAALHALALGFVFSMVFGHAPIIVPAVVRVEVPYRPWFYAPLALLHATLAARLAADATGHFEWLKAAAIGNTLALAAFIVTIAITVATAKRPATARL